MNTRIARFALVILAGCMLSSLSACDPVMSSTILPKGGGIGSFLILNDAEELRITLLPNGSYAALRVNPEGEGYIVEGYSRGLAPTPIWTHLIPFDRLHQITPVWLSGNSEGVTVLYNRYESNDTLSIMGLILDPSSGSPRETRYLTGVRLGSGRFETSLKMLAVSPDSTLFSFYHYDYTNLVQGGSKTVGLVAELFDTKLNHRGSRRIAIPVPDNVDNADDARWRVQSFFLSNEGLGYQVSHHGKRTLRITQIDFAGGSERMLEQEIPGVDFDHGAPLVGATGWTGIGGKVIVASNIAPKEELLGVILVGMDFTQNTIDFVSSMKIDPNIPQALGDKDELDGFRIRRVIRMTGGEIVLPIDQVIRRSFKDGSGSSQIPLTLQCDMVILGFDHLGKPLWNAVQKHSTEIQRDPNFRADSWRVEQDSIHYIYSRDSVGRNILGSHTREYMTGSISARTGAMTTPRSLLQTEMRAEQQHTLWLGSRSVMMVLDDNRDLRLVRVEF